MGYLGVQPEFTEKLWRDLDTNGKAVSGSGSVDITGTLEGAAKTETISTSSTTLTAAQCYGTLIWCDYNSGTQAFVLPPCAVGMMVSFYANKAQVLTIDPDNNDKINLSGTDKADGALITSAGLRGQLITLACHDATFGWTSVGIGGNWS